MRFPKRTVWLFALLGLVLSVGLVTVAEEDERTELEKADELYRKKHYKEALEAYESLLRDAPAREEEARIGLRCVLCIYKLGRWDDAVARGKKYLASHRGSIWEARGALAVGNIIFQQPHYYYKTKVGKISRGRWIRGGYYHDTSAEDFHGARRHIELAKSVAYMLEDRDPEGFKEFRPEVVKINLDLARLYQTTYSWWNWRRFRKEEKEISTRTGTGRYTPHWPTRVKIQALYDEVETYDDSKDKSFTALALYRKACFFRARGARREENKPLPLFRELVRRFPGDALAPDAQFTIARHLEGEKKFLKAKAEYETLLKAFPKSPWVTDCRFFLREMAKPRISMNSGGVRLPGEEPRIKLKTRNLGEVEFTAYPVRLEKVYLDPRNRGASWSDFFSHFLRQGGAYEHREIQVAEWTAKTGDAQDHQWVENEVTVPLKDAGAYVIRARGETAQFESMLLLSDLAVVKKTDNTRLWAYVVDARTGRPVPEAAVHIKERVWTNLGRRWGYQVNLYSGTSGPDGVYTQKIVGTRSKSIQAFAFAGSRYAATGLDHWGRWGRGSHTARIYTYTDRPVYRPGHTVHFRTVVKSKVEGEYKAMAEETFQVTVTGPKRKKMFDGRLTTNAFGTLHGSVKLPKDAPLGMYYVNLKATRKISFYHWGGNRFRVEEYKKPEFKVTVSSDEPQRKAGGKIEVKINATYYFGAPVADAEVTYRVHRKNYRHTYTPPGEYDWLYGRGYGYRPWWWWYGSRWRRAEELVLDGKGKTDAEGNLRLEIDTAEAAKKLPDTDHLYTVKAEVRDKSRRTIQGSGQVKVTRSEYYAFLSSNRGFYQSGERATFKVVTQNAQGAPVASSGKIEVYRLVPREKTTVPEGEKPKLYDEKLLLSDPFQTGENGIGFYKWVSDDVGRFAVVFRAADSWGGEVIGREEVWTVGDKFEGWRFRFADVEILTDKRSYEEGETARIMVNTDNAGAHIFFTLEADNEVLEYRVLDMEKKSVVIPLTLSRRHVPNFFLRAVSFCRGKPFAADREIFVPPARRFLNVGVTSDKEEYLPGEEATFRMKVTDRRGNPVKTEISLGVIDTSVLYIQSEFRSDVRKYYYGDLRTKRTRLHNSLSHGFAGHFRDTAFYEEIKRHGNPPGWGGDAFGRWGSLGGERLRKAGGVTFDAEEEEMDDAGAEGSVKKESKSKDDAPSGFVGGKAAKRRSGGRPAAEPDARARSKMKRLAESQGGGGGELKKAEVRKNFADTAFWTPAAVTGEDGTAEVKFKFPDSLTTWKATAVATDPGACVGNTSTNRITRKNLMVRLQAPRFFVERDEVVLSGLVNNYLARAKKAKVKLTLGGETLKAKGELETWVEIPAGGEKRVDFSVTAVREGKAEVTIEALTDEESDAMRLAFPVLVHGIQKDVTVSGVLREKRRATVNLRVPEERNPEATAFRLILSPSMASNLLEALPYLIEYPYGCVEQTTSRFIPAVVVSRTLRELGIDLETIARKRRDLNAKHLGSRLTRRWYRPVSPVFDTDRLNDIVKQGLDRLYSFQRSDGSFGWWRHGPYNSYMTAYVLYGFLEAKAAGVAVNAGRIQKAVSFLRANFRHEKSLARRCYIAWVLSQAGGVGKEELDLLYKKRDELNVYMKTLLSLALHNEKDAERAGTVLRNVEQLVETDEENGTCWLDTGGSAWWYWYNDSIESNAFLLRALLQVKPDSKRIPQLVKWLVTNRQGARWKSTKDTANCIYALMQYVRAEDELNPEYTITVDWPGVGKKEFNVTARNVFTFDNLFLVGAEQVPAGDHKVEVTVDGKGTLYFTAHLSYFTKEVGIKGSGHEVFVNRSYWRMTPFKRKEKRGGREVQVLDWKRAKLEEGEILRSGERIEVRLDIEAKNHYEYLVFEDPKPAGCEPVQLRSGYSYGNLCSNMELRDAKVVFFLDYLEQGRHAITYAMRAEVPGRFHALPASGYAMYAPRVRGISDEWIMTITD
jgi:uncharacterized protein YfaS (alpha-2-macroglobulin family)/tetratricopeptide (TPR) repeat protein